MYFYTESFVFSLHSLHKYNELYLRIINKTFCVQTPRIYAEFNEFSACKPS